MDYSEPFIYKRDLKKEKALDTLFWIILGVLVSITLILFS